MVEESAAGLFYYVSNLFVYIPYEEYPLQKNVINDIGKALRFANKGGGCVGCMLGHDPKGLVRFKALHKFLMP